MACGVNLSDASERTGGERIQCLQLSPHLDRSGEVEKGFELDGEIAKNWRPIDLFCNFQAYGAAPRDQP
jgi:hypothetical protein